MHLDTRFFYFLQVTRNFDAMAVRIIDKAQSEVMTIALWWGGCKVKVFATTREVQMMFLQTHAQSAHGALTTALPGDVSPGKSRGGKTQKLERPKVPVDCSEVQWAFFLQKWADFKRFYDLLDS